MMRLKNKISQLLFEAAMKQKSVNADTRGIIQILGDFDWNLKSQYDFDGFYRILLKTSFEKYSEEIYDKLYQIKHSEVKIQEEERRKSALEYFQMRLDLAEILLIFKQQKGNIRISYGKTAKELSYELNRDIKELLENHYKGWDLDFSPMTFEEGKEILEQNLCEDVHDFIDDYWNEYATEWGLNEEERAGGYNYDDINDEMVELYINGASLRRSITIEQILNKIQELTKGVKANTKRGAPIKNEKLIAAVSLFSDYKKKFNNKDFRTIYECCDYFKLINDSVKKGWSEISKYPEIKYIISIYNNQSRKYRVEFDEPLPF